jgi:hypothetical protein
MKALNVSFLFLCAMAPMIQAASISVGTSSCAPDFSACSIYESTPILRFPGGGIAISGDVVLVDRFSGGVSDVFRIANDFVDTGSGTGLGSFATLFSDDLHNLPAPATYSANVIFLNESFGNGVGQIATVYNGNGTLYSIFSIDDGAPEPSTFALMGLGAIGLLWRRRKLAQRA